MEQKEAREISKEIEESDLPTEGSIEDEMKEISREIEDTDLPFDEEAEGTLSQEELEMLDSMDEDYVDEEEEEEEEEEQTVTHMKGQPVKTKVSVGVTYGPKGETLPTCSISIERNLTNDEIETELEMLIEDADNEEEAEEEDETTAIINIVARDFVELASQVEEKLKAFKADLKSV